MKIRKAELADLKQLGDIYNYEVEFGTATFDIVPKTIEERRVWFDQHNIGNHPLYVAESETDGHIEGYASLSSYREKEAYKSTVELSVYVAKDDRKKGVATKLMKEVLAYAKQNQELHTVVSVITSGNDASKKLHEAFDFEFCGTIKEVGIKFGEYRGIDNYRLGVSSEQ